MLENSYQQVSPLNRWLITLAIMLAALMQVIDTTIVNVALPHMQGSLGASTNEITWTLTCYLVSSAIFMPLTGYLSDRLGRKNYLMISIFGFTLVSAFCGAATSLNQIIFFRLLQGIFGASLVPLSQAILTDLFPPEERGKAMAIWGMGIMVGPILGPTLGGYLTEIASWRWTFYVNIPFGIVALLLATIIPESIKKIRLMDFTGLILLSLSIGCLQYVLDRGNQNDWFSANSICIVSYIMVVSFAGFLMHIFQEKSGSVFNYQIFKDRNFTISGMLLCVFGLGLYGVMVIQPMMMENLFHYSVLTTGLIMAPRGLSSIVSMLLVGKIIQRVDARLLIAGGIVISTLGMYMGTEYSVTSISPFWLITPLLIQGFGMGMVFVPLATVAFSTLPVNLRTDAAGVFSLLRTIGGSMGISVAITLFTRKSQIFWQQLIGFINPYNSEVAAYLQNTHLTTQKSLGIAYIGKEISEQVSMLAFINVYAFISGCFLCMLPLVLMLKKPKQQLNLDHQIIEG